MTENSTKKSAAYIDYLNNRYEGVGAIMNNEKYTKEDLLNFLRFQDSDKTNKGFQNWETYMRIVDKIRTKGIASVLLDNNVNGTEKGAEDFGRDGGIVIYTIVKTKYGDIWVSGDRNVVYIR